MFGFDGSKLVFNNSPLVWIDLVLALLVCGAAGFAIFRVIKRKLVWAIYSAVCTLVLFAWMFSLNFLFGVSLAAAIVCVVIFFTVNIAEVRPLISNTLAGNQIGFGKKNVDKIFDRHALYAKIDVAVKQLSKTKTGAIITFERNVELTDFVKSGTLINAPVTPELLATIFYPGTRLHDGAVVIRRDQILAASVYYTPTTKPLTGKFGSRHRAAIGISEITDSVTVVVSEETGRVSLAIAGELISVNIDNFLRTFEEYMFEEDTNSKKE